MKDISSMLKPFKEYLTILNRSPETIQHHIWRLKRFIRFLDGYNIQDIQDVTQEHIFEHQKYRHYRQNRYGRQDVAHVQNYHLSSIKCFFHWLKLEGYIPNDPSEAVQYAKEPKQLPKDTLTDSEMKKLLKIPDTGTKEGYRDRTMLEIFYSTGIRRSELLNLKKEDIDYEGGYLRVNQGKGNKDRVVPLGKIACKYAENYIKGIRPWFVNSREIPELFVGKKGYRLSNSGLGEIIKKYAVKSEIAKPISAHTFRRTCATEMIRNNANLMHVKEMLGHSSMEATQIYCNLSITDLKKAHAKYHPREKDEK